MNEKMQVIFFLKEKNICKTLSNISRYDINRLELGILWASQANTIPATFWAIAYIISDSIALKEVSQEITTIIQDRIKKDNLQPLSDQLFTKESLEKMELLDSAISEAFRMSTSSIVLRQVRESCSITLHSGQQIHLRKGDRVCLFPAHTHNDPEIYEDPKTFKFDRFLYPQKEDKLNNKQENDHESMSDDNVGIKTKKFFKKGQWVKFNLVPFGGGVSQCPGRFFARNEIKLFVAILLFYFDMKIVGKLPTLDNTRAG